MAQYSSRVLVLALLSIAACGDEDEGGGKKSVVDPVGSACGDICDGMRAAKCGGIDLTQCETQCEAQVASVPLRCKSLADQLLDCASKATYSCGSDGPAATFCAPLEITLDSCMGAATSDAGVPVGPAADASTSPFADAGSSSADAATSADAAPTPNTQGDAGAMPSNDASTPGRDSGLPSDVISCEPAADDGTCDLCMKRSCCTPVQACGRACQELAECVGECLTQACVSSCINAHPAGVQAFDAVLTCTQASCSSVCGDDEPTTPRPSNVSPRPPPQDRCLPSLAPEGTCSDPRRPNGYDCVSAPFSDCVPLPELADVYCCG